MAFSADAHALLELILAKGQTYEDIASLLDVSKDEARGRAREALTELAGGTDPDRSVALTDWLLGQADQIDRVDVARHLREDPEDNRLATELLAALRELAPDAELPQPPGAPGGGRRPRRPKPESPKPKPAQGEGAAAGRSFGRLGSLDEAHRTRLIVGLGAAAVLLVVVVLAITGAFGGEEDSPGGTSAADSTTTDAPSEDIQAVPLEPSAGGDAQGLATFGIAGESQAFVDLKIENLEPAPAGKAYVLWLLTSEDEGHPLTPFQASQEGSYSEQIPIASFLTELAARTQLVDVSLAPRKPLLEAVAVAVEEGTPVIDYTGESVLRGSVTPTGEEAGAAEGDTAPQAPQGSGG
ncbi:MAG: anti-sigma factor domain-containing protein [Solirubrobacterales bacterium]